jgi:pimeloyl-ACP methyl ester carboxylesterase
MGTDDRSKKAWFELFLTNLLYKFPNSTFAVLNLAGHMLQIEKRDGVQALLKDWLTSSD